VTENKPHNNVMRVASIVVPILDSIINVYGGLRPEINTNTGEFLKRQFAVTVFVASEYRLVNNLLQLRVFQVRANH